MKKILLAVCLTFGGASLVVAQNDPSSTPSQTQTTQEQDKEKQQIAVSELPEAVTAKLESQDFSGWAVGNAYKKMDDSNQEMYIVELKQGTETKKVKFDRDGNEIEKKDHDKADANYRDSETEESMKSEESATEESSALDESAETDESAVQSEETDQSTTDQADDSSTETNPQ